MEATPPLKATAEPMFVQMPLPILTWKVAVPVGFTPRPETVIESDSEFPTVVELEGFKDTSETVGAPAFTVNEDAEPVAAL